MKNIQFNKLKNIKELEIKELIDINGGTWGFDIGWLLGHSIAGNFSLSGLLDEDGYADAVAAYVSHYM